MTYLEAMEFISSRPRFAQAPTLDRIKRITSYCGDSQRSMRFIHIAGTNGKGSIAAMVSSMLQSAGYRVATYTSPYIINFRDRFCINGEMVSEQSVAAAVDIIKPIVEQMDKEGSYANQFEINTAVAFLIFSEQKCDYTVLEVGLGGRYDATNVISAPEVAVITHIDLDHTDILGDTVEQIALEKCGIIKSGCRVVVYPEQYSGAMQTVRDACRQKGCELVVPEIPNGNSTVCGCEFEYNGEMYKTRLIGAHQIKNAVTALCAVKSLNIDIASNSVKSGLARATIPARQEILSTSPLIMLDGAHNPDGLAALAQTVKSLPQRPVGIIGMLADKDVERSLAIIAPCFERVFTVCVSSPRTVTAESLAKLSEKYCSSVEPMESAELALKRAVACSKNGAVICGSLYLASEIRPKILEIFK